LKSGIRPEREAVIAKAILFGLAPISALIRQRCGELFTKEM